MPLELDELQDLLDPKSAKQKFRQAIFDSFHGKCVYCDRRAESLDHIKPKFRGGDDRLTNLVPCCNRCNQNKGSQEMTVWWERQYYWDLERYESVLFWVENGYSVIDQSGV